MSERRSQTKSIPLRVRFRSPIESGQGGREPIASSNGALQYIPPPMPDLSHASEAEWHTQQTKELVRLHNLLRTDMSLEALLGQIATSFVAYTSFRMLVIKLVDETGLQLTPVTFAGVPEEDQRLLREAPFPLESIVKLMRAEFRISQSYFISHEYADIFADKAVAVHKTADDYKYGNWHPDDYFFVPLYSFQGQKLLGCLSLDEPKDDKIPSEGNVETIELFAHVIALAVDHAFLAREREAEQRELARGIVALNDDIKLLQQGNLHLRVRSSHEKLAPVADAINNMVEGISLLFSNTLTVAQTVDEHSRNVQRNAEALVYTTKQQKQHMHQISQSANEITHTIQSISEQASTLDKAVRETDEVTNEAQTTVDHAVEGMSMVREATMQSARTMKALSESGQEINETIVALTDLTMRMHLLALNAAIEATRAGEHGQGFAVVAQEIRNLAAHSSDAARKVAAYIRAIQQEATAVSQSVEQSTQQVIVQTERVTQTSVSLDAIEVMAERLTQLIKEMLTTVANQAEQTLPLMNATNEISRMTGDATHYAHEMQQSTAHLTSLTNTLRSQIAEIRLRER